MPYEPWMSPLSPSSLTFPRFLASVHRANTRREESTLSRGGIRGCSSCTRARARPHYLSVCKALAVASILAVQRLLVLLEPRREIQPRKIRRADADHWCYPDEQPCPTCPTEVLYPETHASTQTERCISIARVTTRNHHPGKKRPPQLHNSYE